MRKEDDFVIGIDEAGMGPVFGPLVVAGAAILTESVEKLSVLGVKDSKKFGGGARSLLRREEVRRSAEPYIMKSFSVVIEPDEIRSGLLYPLHITAVRRILEELNWRESSVVYIDRLGGTAREKFLSRLGFWHRDFIYEKKADQKYPAVSMASLIAKTERDCRVSGLCRDLGEEYISGYANSATEGLLRRYFDKHGKLPPGTRRSYAWAPITEMIRAGG